MVRKVLLLLLLGIGLQNSMRAQLIDTVHIIMPYGTDTTCPGIQLNFSASHSSSTDTVVAYHWYTNTSYTGVSIDSFHTTAVADGDSVYCWMVYLNGFGVLDSVRSSTIIIHRSSSIAPRVVISLIAGSNPGCAGHLLKFLALPVNGGDTTLYQWFINSTPQAGEDSITYSGIFAAGDTVKCQMISNSVCSAPFDDTVMSPGIPVIHDSLTANISIIVKRNPICAGSIDTFFATTGNAGTGYTLSWYVDSTLIPGALGPDFPDDTLINHDLVYCILNAPDPCVINHTTVSNPVTMTVISLASTSAYAVLTQGSNPGCLDSPVTFVGHFLNFSHTQFPVYTWYVNGTAVLAGDSVLTRYYLNNDILTYRVYDTSGGCFAHDTVNSPAIVMLRDSTPATPLLSLIGNLLVVNNGGQYKWYLDSTLVPGVINQTYHPGPFGGYYFVVKDSAGCPSLPSNVIYIALTGVKNIETGRMAIYPNPTSSLLNMDWGQVKSEMNINVYNLTGQVVDHDVFLNQSGAQVNLSRLPAGEYFIEVTDQDGNKGNFKIERKP